MKRSTKIIIGSVIGVGLVGAVTAKKFDHCDFGSGFGHGHGAFSSMEHSPRAQWMQKKVTRVLDLNVTQQAQLSQLKTHVFESLQEMRSEKPDVSEIQALFNNEFDQVKAMQLLEHRSQALKDKAPQLITAFAEFYNQLDAEQQTKINNIIEHRMEQGDHGWGHRGGFSHE